MKATPILFLTLLTSSISAQETVTVQGLILPRDDSGMYLRSRDGEIEIGWSEKTQVALEVNTRQLAQFSEFTVASKKLKPRTKAEQARESMTAAEREALDHPKRTFAAAGSVIEDFLSAKSYEECLKYVRDPKRVGELMKKHYLSEAYSAVEFRKPEDGWQMHPYESFLITNVQTTDFENLAVAVERQSDGKYLIDWESFVGYSDLPWEEISEKRPTEPLLIRARASLSSYYNFGFTEEVWACVQLQDQDGDHNLYGYIKLDDPLLKELGRVMSPRAASHVTLKVAFPEDAKADNQVLITEVVTNGWVTPASEKPTSEGFTFKYHVPSSKEVVNFDIPSGPITGIVGVKDVKQARDQIEEEHWISEHGLRLFFDQIPESEQLPSKSDPRFLGIWNPSTKPRTLSVLEKNYEISLKKGGQANALLFNLLSTDDCKPFINRATVIGRKEGGVIIADEIHLTPIGDQAAGDDPSLPRYLFIGDSISGNYTAGLREHLKGKFNLHHPPTNCGSSSKGKENIVEWLGAYQKEGRGWDVISFNFGHWDASTDKESYQSNLEAIITELEKTGAKLVWVTTCPVPEGNDIAGEPAEKGKAPGRKAGVMQKYLNPWAVEVIAKHPGITICDQWQFVREDTTSLYKEWWTGKDVHFRGDAAAALGKLLGAHVEQLIAK